MTHETPVRADLVEVIHDDVAEMGSLVILAPNPVGTIASDGVRNPIIP
jgi:hypothetical protein